ncbi:stage II sporulation protein P [Blautia obeum]|uniref:stage II sporulation protein P n=1 Tax=Blautia obeum TaxID=40520 RepID=UPI0035671435
MNERNGHNSEIFIIGYLERGDSVTRTRKTICTLMCLAFFAVLAVMPGSFIMQKNVYRQLPLFRFLERKAARDFQRKDPDTYAKIVENHTEYLGAMVEKENEEVRKEQEKVVGQAQKEAADKQKKDSEKETEKSQRNKSVTATPEVTQAVLVSNNIQPAPRIDLSPQTLADYNYLMNQFFIVDSQTTTNADQLNAAELLGEDLTIQKDAAKPQILLYHTHSQEAFADSKEGEVEDTIIGVGNYLTELLTKNYGYQVIHVTEAFDMESGELDRSAAYDYAGTYLETILEENPSIEVVIDLHRDGVPENRHLVTEINGKSTAQIMFYNGLSYTIARGSLDYLPNPYIQDNLAFSFQMEYQAAQYYPDFYRGIYLAGYRYNLHLRPRSVLVEAGAQTNTVQEVKNAMEPFADILNRVLQN